LIIKELAEGFLFPLYNHQIPKGKIFHKLYTQSAAEKSRIGARNAAFGRLRSTRGARSLLDYPSNKKRPSG
jgi:hypothetical protein